MRECARLLCDEVDGNDAAKDALDAAHDPALGEDRSVNLGAFLDWMTSEMSPAVRVEWKRAALREFGAGDHAR